MDVIDPATRNEIRIQRAYYAESANQYDDMHLHEDDAHSFALQFMLSAIEHFGIRSILDVGSGTGRGLLAIKMRLPDAKIVGIEPSAGLRNVGYSKGLLETELIDGDAMDIAFSDGSFDLVCEFGALHHIPVPSKAVSEMLRVSRDAIFISDCNNFGQGSKASRLLKQSIYAVGLWPFVDLIKTRGEGLHNQQGRWAGVFLFRIQRLQTNQRKVQLYSPAKYGECWTEPISYRSKCGASWNQETQTRTTVASS